MANGSGRVGSTGRRGVGGAAVGGVTGRSAAALSGLRGAGSGAADSEPGLPRAGTGFPGKDSGGTNQSDSMKRGLRSTCRRAPEEEPRPLRSANHGAPARPEREALWDGGKRELGGLPGNGGERRGARASLGRAAGPRLFSALLPFRLRAQPF